MLEETLTQQFAVPAKARVFVENVRGLVDIQPGESGQIIVTAEKFPETGNANRTEIQITQEDGGDVRVRTHYREGLADLFRFRGGQICKVEYTLHVPQGAAITVETVSSVVKISGLAGAFALETVSGDLTLQDLEGPCKLETVSGSCSGRGLRGPLGFSSVSGDGRFEGGTFEGIDIETVSGDVRVESPLGPGLTQLKTVSGNIWISLPIPVQARVRTSTVSGHIRHPWKQFPAAQLVDSPEIRFTSISGNLEIKHPALEQPPADPHTRLDVLEQIASGSLTVDEALSVLAAGEASGMGR